MQNFKINNYKGCAYQGLIRKYYGNMPLVDGKIIEESNIVSLNEGRTPLIKLDNFCQQNNLELKLYVKFEGLNPTGSFKDRGMTLAITHAKQKGIKAVICASTGNTSASAAAYAARGGMSAIVIIPNKNVALGKLTQAVVYGAKIIRINGNFDDGMRVVKEVSDNFGLGVVNSINPYRLQGQKTASFEIFEELNEAPDYHALPVGNAGNISGYWMGYKELQGEKTSYNINTNSFTNTADTAPVMLGYQADGSAPFIYGNPITSPETVATAICIGNPQSYEFAQEAIKNSKGWFDSVKDEKILQAQMQLASTEGVFCEPASAISIAGVMADYQSGKIAKGSTVVCTLTGNGIKDPQVVENFYDIDKLIINTEADNTSICKTLETIL